jgi:hypothetical protein
MTVDKILKYAGIVVSLSSAVAFKFNVFIAFMLFFFGMILIKFSAHIKISRELDLFHFGDKNG